MDRLSAIDASFLAQERDGSHMHIGGVLVFEGPPPEGEEFVEHVESRLGLVPRYRQKIVEPRFEMGRPLWVDDPRFNIDYHVRHTALPEPGSVEQLRNLTARIFAQRLDRTKPLWEMWLVQGLERDRFAVISKVHHCLVDGVSGVDLSAVLFDTSREPAVPPDPGPEWVPAPEPSQAAIVAEGVRGLVRAPLALAGDVSRVLASPSRTRARAFGVATGIAEATWSVLEGAPPTPLNVEIGPHRRVSWVRVRLADLKSIKDDLGGTVNDVFLTLVSGAIGRWLRSRGTPTEGLELKAAVPVSIRAEDQHGELGNQITQMIAPLPVYCEHPVERLRIVSAAMQGLKESKQALGAEAIAGLQGLAPPTLFAQSSRLNFSTRVYNLLCTNVPGPQFPLYLLGRELDELVPVPFLVSDRALAIACMSYNGNVDFGLMSDYDAFPELEEFAAYIAEGVEELLDVARTAA